MIKSVSVALRFIRSSRGLGAQDVRWTSVLRGPEWNGDFFPNKQKCAGYIPGHCLPSSEIRNDREDKTMENVTFDYKFYRIPKRFFKEDMFRDMTNAAKVLYGILLDRKCLSDSNGDAWRDEYGITYIIFTIEEIMNLMNLGNKKVNKMVKELEEHGLIYRRHQGLGRPNKIYVYDLLKADNSNWLPKQIIFGKGSSNEKEVL